MRRECKLCHLKTIEKLLVKHSASNEQALVFKSQAEVILDKEEDNPYLATEIHRLAKSVFAVHDLYLEEKVDANELLLERYEEWRAMISEHEQPFAMAAKMAVAGNVIDYGAHSVPVDIEVYIKELLNKGLSIDETEMLEEKLKKAKSVLYLGDNAGEIVFDKLFIETINHRNLTYVVRGEPVINDVTLDDAFEVKMNEVCPVINNGYDAPSTLLDFCSDEFIKAYHKADLIISKGQGNFEGLMNSGNKKIFFLLMAKCQPMAEMLGVNKGDMVVKQLKQ